MGGDRYLESAKLVSKVHEVLLTSTGDLSLVLQLLYVNGPCH
jgi:hypothetical protein